VTRLEIEIEFPESLAVLKIGGGFFRFL